MEEVSLYYEKRPGITISIKMYFDKEGLLRFDGYDFGALVEELKGNDDYEYCYTIQPGEFAKLYTAFGILGNSRIALLEAIREQFSVYDAFTKFGKFMDANRVEYSRFTW
ncbi:hypothetical protein HYN59_08980 [Flavobacterium album]|uniref:Uncharacterized protein n=1 Tax=Flavobacterium album TaxID=2175091 RepID=A0A2S1QXW7_9FLAO|nr:hypothetical protein [Flavobacterium album]AWH85243.1 hypothetical protein HYN59_08980 [Flavobacterium album]